MKMDGSLTLGNDGDDCDFDNSNDACGGDVDGNNVCVIRRVASQFFLLNSQVYEALAFLQ